MSHPEVELRVVKCHACQGRGCVNCITGIVKISAEKGKPPELCHWCKGKGCGFCQGSGYRFIL